MLFKIFRAYDVDLVELLNRFIKFFSHAVERDSNDFDLVKFKITLGKVI